MSARLRISAAPIDWGIGGVDPRNPAPDEILDWVAAAGYEGCELGPLGYFGETAEAVLAVFDERNLALTASWYDVDLAEPLDAATAQEIDVICGLLEAGSASILNISARITDERLAVVSRVPQFPETWWDEDDWTQVPLTLAQIAELAAGRGVTVALHPHVATHIETAYEVRRALESIEDTPVRLCLDTGHLILGGSDPIALLHKEGDRLAHLHAKDVDEEILARMKAGEIGYVDAVGSGLYCELGAGMVDWPELARALVASGYTGWVVAEQDKLLTPGDRYPFDANARNLTFLRQLLADTPLPPNG